MRAQQSGFTLIELIVVIVILGILGAVAVPKFVDLSVDAADASAKASVGALNSAISLNYTKRSANSTAGTAVAAGAACSTLLPLMTGGALSSDADVAFVTPAATLTCGSVGGIDNTTCKIKHAKGTATGFAVSVICTD